MKIFLKVFFVSIYRFSGIDEIKMAKQCIVLLLANVKVQNVYKNSFFGIEHIHSEKNAVATDIFDSLRLYLNGLFLGSQDLHISCIAESVCLHDRYCVVAQISAKNIRALGGVRALFD